MIRAVCIDLDGTLLDTVPDLAAAANAMLSPLNLAPLPVDLIRQFVGKGAEVLIDRTLKAAGVDTSHEAGLATRAQAGARFYANYRQLNGTHAALYEGVIEGLNVMRGMGLKLACVTNKPGEFVGPLLHRFGLDGYFDFSIAGDTLPVKKPHPGQFLEACRRWSLEPVNVLAVGDSSNDAEAARTAGMRVFLVPYGYNEGASVYSVDVDGIVLSLSELASLIQAQNARFS